MVPKLYQQTQYGIKIVLARYETISKLYYSGHKLKLRLVHLILCRH